MTPTPIGDLCVLKDARSDTWAVAICWGGIREFLGRFDDATKAADFALAERDRRLAEGASLTIHFPDDCPCYRALL